MTQPHTYCPQCKQRVREDGSGAESELVSYLENRVKQLSEMLYLSEMFWTKVRKTDTCWFWTAHKSKSGYGTFWAGKRKTVRAHRFSYELKVGPIDPTKVVDHLCRKKDCVNPAHLEVVSIKENTLRGLAPSAFNAKKTKCNYGHSFDKHGGIASDKSRLCKICRKRWQKLWRLQNPNKVKAYRVKYYLKKKAKNNI